MGVLTADQRGRLIAAMELIPSLHSASGRKKLWGDAILLEALDENAASLMKLVREGPKSNSSTWGLADIVDYFDMQTSMRFSPGFTRHPVEGLIQQAQIRALEERRDLPDLDLLAVELRRRMRAADSESAAAQPKASPTSSNPRPTTSAPTNPTPPNATPPTPGSQRPPEARMSVPKQEQVSPAPAPPPLAPVTPPPAARQPAAPPSSKPPIIPPTRPEIVKALLDLPESDNTELHDFLWSHIPKDIRTHVSRSKNPQFDFNNMMQGLEDWGTPAILEQFITAAIDYAQSSAASQRLQALRDRLRAANE
jgi:hypothetical protein